MYSNIIDKLSDYFPPENQIVTHGTKMQFRFEGFISPVTGILVGMIHEKCLIVNIKGFTDVSELKGKTASVSYLYEGSLIEFTTAVTETLGTPEKLIFLGFPKKINKKTLRTLDRTPCYLPAILLASGKAHKCIINNISDSGCNLVVKTTGAAPPKFVLKEIIKLDFKLPGDPKEIELSGKIRNAKRADTEVNVGVQFSYISDEISQRLNSFIASIV